jgi:UPF0271 protein
MKVVLDTSALIYLSDFRGFGEMLTVQEVIEEVRDRTTAMKLFGVNVKVLEPAGWTLKKVRQTARKTGDIDKLSKTDMKLLALAEQQGATIVSDDRNVQNVAERMQIPYLSVFNEKITKLITWRKYCSNCKKYFNSGRTCRLCGSRLKRVPIDSKKVEG